jgi:anti-anti-sigma factor
VSTACNATERSGLLEVQVSRGGDGGPVVACIGELDLATRPQLEAVIQRLRRPYEIASLTVDLTGVTFADSSALHLVREAKRRCTADDVILHLISGEAVAKLFALLHVEQIVDAHGAA